MTIVATIAIAIFAGTVLFGLLVAKKVFSEKVKKEDKE
jgi:hypothetical protein